jgi:hypothetical protein
MQQLMLCASNNGQGGEKLAWKKASFRKNIDATREEWTLLLVHMFEF